MNLIDVRLYMAKTKISEKVQLLLSRDVDNDVRCSLAENFNISEKTMLILTEGDIDVTTSLAINDNITEKIQLILTKCKDFLTKEFLIENPNLSKKNQIDFIKR